MTAYLSVPGGDLPRRMLSPLLEEGEEDYEGHVEKPPTLDEYIPRDVKSRLCMTQINSINNDSDDSEGAEAEPKGADVSSEDITLNLNMNVGCFLDDANLSDEDDYISDGSLSIGTDDFDTDLEVDEDSLLNPSRCDHDTTGRTKYMKVCTEMGINPVSYFVKNLEQRELKMRFHGLGPLGIKAISIPLETNTNIEILNLEGNGIDAQGSKCLCRVLRENLFLTEVVLSENKIGTEGAIALCQFLKGNRNLFKVDLTANEIGDSAGQSFYEVLKGNPVLRELILSNNKLEENGAKWFRDALMDNENLEILDLSWNQFKTKGAIWIANGLQENVGLKRFKLAMGGLGKPGAEAMSLALKNNRTLLELDISYNRIPMEGAHAIAAGLKVNDVLKRLKIGNNPFDSDGAMVILQAIDQNDSSALKYLDFSNIMVKIEFAEIENRLKETRELTVVNEGVLPEMHPKNGNYARLSAFRRDPIETFKKYAEFSGVKLEDVFNTKRKMQINAAEFKALVKGSGIEIPDQQLTVLIRTLEENNYICYWRIFQEEGSETGAVTFADESRNGAKPKDTLSRKGSGTSRSSSVSEIEKPKSAKAKKKKEKDKKKKK